jgi:hypothetical protein
MSISLGLRRRRTVWAARCAVPSRSPDRRVKHCWRTAAPLASADVVAQAHAIARAQRRWICPSLRCHHARLTGQVPLGRHDVNRQRLHHGVRATGVAVSTPSIAISDFSRQQSSLRVDFATRRGLQNGAARGILSIVRRPVRFAPFRRPNVGFLAGNVGSMSGFFFGNPTSVSLTESVD